MIKDMSFWTSPLFWKSLAIITMFAVIIIWQWRSAFRPQQITITRIGRNLGLWGANIILSPLIITPLTAYCLSFAFWDRPDWMLSGYYMLIDVLILDCWIYFWHRWNHEVPFLWRFHAVHHYDQTMDVFTAFRFHPGEVFFSALARLPLILLLSIPLETVILFETLLFCNALYHHGNIRLPNWMAQTLARMFVSPNWHWVHHHAVQKDTDSHYGGLLIIWDFLFKTTHRQIFTKDMPIGVQSRRDHPLWYLLLVRPFQRS